MARFLDIRPNERKTTFAAFFTLLGITAGHTLLETARDALFLARLPASQLPWVYLGIAAAGLAIARINLRRSGKAHSSRGVTISLLISAAVTAGFWGASATTKTPFLYALYLWTGIFASWVIVQFWLLLGSVYSHDKAKRIYGFIGTGSVLGAVAGAAGARALAAMLPVQHLLLGAAAMFVLTALGPVLAVGAPEDPARRGRAPGATPAAGAAKTASLGDDLKLVVGHAYVKRVLLLVLLSTVTVTTVDYLFKASVAERIEPADLGAFFANVYVVLNALALAVQLLGVGWVMRTFGVRGAIALMPLLIVLGAGGVLAGGGLIAAVILKGTDGALRHSLQRTSTELLYVPIPDAMRGRAKPFIDLVGQRGGQALASLMILGLVALGARELGFAAAIMTLGVAWIAVAIGIRRHYLDVFRDILSEGRVDDRGELPELDLNALEALFSALNSGKDSEVLCALDLLAEQRRQRLIPALILYHPSRRIVLRALELFVREGRTDFVPIADRLLEHSDIEVRTAALRARTAVKPDETFVRGKLSDPDMEVRATALVSALSHEWISGDEAEKALAAMADDAAPAVRVALARAIAQEPSPRMEDTLDRLMSASEAEVRLETAWAMGRTRNERFVAKLLPLLPSGLEASGARDALVELGAPALAALDRAMDDLSISREIRWSIPRAVAMFEPRDAAPVLMRHLEREDRDGTMRYRILRALKRLRSIDPELPLERRVLFRITEENVKRAFELLAQRIAIESAASKPDARNTPALQLIIVLLKDKEAYTVQRILLLLGLAFAEENFDRIARGLQSENPKARASSLELIEGLVEQPLRSHIIALIDDVPDEERLSRAAAEFRPAESAYEELIRQFQDRDDELGTLAAYHGNELGIRSDRRPSATRGLMASLIESAAAGEVR